MGNDGNKDNDRVNNGFYDRYGDRWYTAKDDPVALLRAEGRIKTAWILETLNLLAPGESLSVLDVGCGGGFIANGLSAAGHRVTGIDISLPSLVAAAGRDASRSANYLLADGYKLPFADNSFRTVCAMDFLEHVEDPERAVGEAARVLAGGGMFFFHTINRNFLSWLLVIKGVEWFVKNTPGNMHVLRLFIRPGEMREYCKRAGLEVKTIRGIRPLFNRDLFRIPFSGIVGDGFGFTYSDTSLISYIGYAIKG